MNENPKPASERTSYRVLITGSRDWPHHDVIWDAIDAAWEVTPAEVTELVIVHGVAAGADTMAADYCSENAAFFEVDGCSLVEERHPAHWNLYGKRAGYVRNQEMVDAGADLCLAFIHNNSRGATTCADLAEKAGIPTQRFTPHTQGRYAQADSPAVTA